MVRSRGCLRTEDTVSLPADREAAWDKREGASGREGIRAGIIWKIWHNLA